MTFNFPSTVKKPYSSSSLRKKRFNLIPYILTFCNYILTVRRMFKWTNATHQT